MMMTRWLRVSWLLAVAGICSAADLPNHAFVAYHDSWNEWPASAASQTSLANLPGYIDMVVLAFAKPDAAYSGGLDIARTGLQYRMPGNVLRDAVAMLKHSRPDTRVLLSVGGAAYGRWDHLALPAIAALVHDLDLDGVDIDFEPTDPHCAINAQGHIACTSDPDWDRIVQRTRAAFPRPLLVTASVWSVGAYGESEFRGSLPRSRYTGMMLPLLRSARSADLDLLSINAYDAGPHFDPMEAFSAYRTVWPGRLALGIEIQRDGGTGPFHSGSAVEKLAAEVVKDPLGGMMLYPLLALPGDAQRNAPTGSDLARAICRGLGSQSCAATIP